MLEKMLENLGERCGDALLSVFGITRISSNHIKSVEGGSPGFSGGDGHIYLKDKFEYADKGPALASREVTIVKPDGEEVKKRQLIPPKIGNQPVTVFLRE